jgi:acetolactate synthase-1/2/3 large subunit
MVRQWQDLFYEGRLSGVDLATNPDFVKVAEAFGATGLRATRPEEVRPIIEQAINTPGPVFMEFVVDRSENVFPMVPSGKAINEMIGIIEGMA